MNPHLIEKHGSAEFCQWRLVYSRVGSHVFINIGLSHDEKPSFVYHVTPLLPLNIWCMLDDDVDSFCTAILLSLVTPHHEMFTATIEASGRATKHHNLPFSFYWSNHKHPWRRLDRHVEPRDAIKLFFCRSGDRTSAATIRSPCRAARCHKKKWTKRRKINKRDKWSYATFIWFTHHMAVPSTPATEGNAKRETKMCVYVSAGVEMVWSVCASGTGNRSEKSVCVASELNLHLSHWSSLFIISYPPSSYSNIYEDKRIITEWLSASITLYTEARSRSPYMQGVDGVSGVTGVRLALVEKGPLVAVRNCH